jgi:hypothetical protein
MAFTTQKTAAAQTATGKTNTTYMQMQTQRDQFHLQALIGSNFLTH